jgi:peptidoglycan/xylan/chitin deacetylase (PgdA/CDA1 family)
MRPRPPTAVKGLKARWVSSAVRNALKLGALRMLSMVPPRRIGVSHVFLHAVPPELMGAFAQLLDALLEEGPILPMSEALRREDAGDPKCAFSLSFDDGYHSAVTAAGLHLAGRHLSATYFVPSGFVGLTGDALKQYMWEGLRWPEVIEPATRDELIHCRRLGHEVGSHGISHRAFSEMSPTEAKKELEGSRSMLEDMVGSRVRYFAWPFGAPSYFRNEYVEMARDAGYERLFAASTKSQISAFGGTVRPRRALDLRWGVRVCKYLALRG